MHSKTEGIEAVPPDGSEGIFHGFPIRHGHKGGTGARKIAIKDDKNKDGAWKKSERCDEYLIYLGKCIDNLRNWINNVVNNCEGAVTREGDSSFSILETDDMDLEFSTLILLCAAFFFAGIIDAISGGGGLLTLPTFLLAGFPAHFVAGTNQCSCLLGSITAAFRYMKEDKIYWFTALISAATAVPGSVLGARLNLIMPERYLQILMVVLLPVVAIVLLVNQRSGTENRVETLSRPQQITAAVMIGFLLGGYTGFYGAGGGTFILLSFVFLNRLDLVTASGNTKVCSTFATITASLTYALSGAVVWPAAIAAAVFNIAGNYIGAGLALRNGKKIIQPMFLLVLILLFARLIYTLFV